MTITKPSITNSFTANTDAKASQVNTNFTDVIDIIEDDGYISQGWFLFDNASFEYNDSSSLKTTADIDLTSVIQKGDKITWEHSTTTGDRFGYVIDIDYNSTVTNRTWIKIGGGTDYAVLNESLVSNSVGISRIQNPMSFPLGFDWTPSFTGFTGSVTVALSNFILDGNKVIWSFKFSGTSNATNFKATLPVPVKSGLTFVSPTIQTVDNGTKQGNGNAFNNSSTEMTLEKTSGTATTWTASGSKQANGFVIYDWQ